jgi:hypothetical protein
LLRKLGRDRNFPNKIMGMKQMILGRILSVGLCLSIVSSICIPTSAQQSSIPAFEALHLDAWTPKNDFRSIRQLSNNGSASFGFNEEFIWGFMQSKGVTCSGCATNSPAIPLAVVQSYLTVLAQHGVRSAREIVPERYLSEASNYALAATVFKQYQKHNFILILGLSWPVEHAPGKCFGFAEDATFDRAAYDYSVGAARLILYLRGLRDLDRNWVETHVLIDPWNEFDAMCKGEIGSPQKAARYQGITQMIFDRIGLKNEVLMPSIVNAYKGRMNTPGGGKYGTLHSYLRDYYAAGGSGRPNIHWYYDPRWGSSAETLNRVLEGEIQGLGNSVPPTYRRTFLIGETGISALSGVAKCNAHGLADASRKVLYVDMIKSAIFSHNAHMILFWRLLGLEGLTPEEDNCDQFYGITTKDWPSATTPAGALGTLSQTGSDMLNAISRP